MSLQVSVTITGDDRVRRKMKRLGSSLYNFQSAMKEVGREGSRYYQGTAWLSRGGVFGNKWEGLSPQYAKRKAKKYPGRNILVATGTMQNSFDYEATRNSVTLGNRAPYFKYHQSTEPRKKIPRRQMIGVTRGFRKLVEDIIRDDVRDKIRNA